MISLVGAIIPLAGKLLGKFLKNKGEKAKFLSELSIKLAEQETKLIESLTKSDVAQAEINKAIKAWYPLDIRAIGEKLAKERMLFHRTQIIEVLDNGVYLIAEHALRKGRENDGTMWTLESVKEVS